MPFAIPHPRALLALGVALLALLATSPVAGAHDKKNTRAYGATTLALDASAASALQSLGVTAAPLAPATAGSDGLSFPIVNPLRDALRVGAIRHTGGIALSGGGKRIDLRDFTINLDSSPDLTARVGKARVSILDLDLAKARIAFVKGGLRIGPVGATLTQAAADALNATFGVTAFAKGLKLARRRPATASRRPGEDGERGDGPRSPCSGQGAGRQDEAQRRLRLRSAAVEP